jgi:hypothetical protein
MKNIKVSIMSIIIILAFLLTGCSSRPVGHADYPFYPTLQDAYDASDSVIVGKVVKIEKEKVLESVIINSENREYELNKDTSEDINYDSEDIKLKKSVESIKQIKEKKMTKDELNSEKNKMLKNSVTYDVYSVEVLNTTKGIYKIGETIQIKLLSYDDTAQKKGKMSINDEYYFFLMDYNDIDASIPASLLNPSQGKIAIKDSYITEWDEAYNDELSGTFTNVEKDNMIEKGKFNEYLEELDIAVDK